LICGRFLKNNRLPNISTLELRFWRTELAAILISSMRPLHPSRKISLLKSEYEQEDTRLCTMLISRPMDLLMLRAHRYRESAAFLAKSVPAYSIIAAPDFFPATGQRELMNWVQSNAIPNSSLKDQIWGKQPS